MLGIRANTTPGRESLSISVPGIPKAVGILLDHFGEQKEMFSVMCYDSSDEFSVQIRYDANGDIAEVFVRDGIAVVRESDESKWFKERDGV